MDDDLWSTGIDLPIFGKCQIMFYSGGQIDEWKLSLFSNGYRAANDSCIKDDNFCRIDSVINTIVCRVHHLDDRISCFEVKRFAVRRDDHKLPACQHPGIDHRIWNCSSSDYISWDL